VRKRWRKLQLWNKILIFHHSKLKHYELHWQNDKNLVKPSYGTIKFPIEGDSAQISLKKPFALELGVEL